MPKKGITMPKMGKTAVRARRRPGGKVSSRASRLARTSLADALFTSTQQRVLGFLYGQPERSFFANELITATGSGSGAVQRELARLTESGLVTSRQIGRERHYQANARAPVFDELRSIIVKTTGIAEPLRSALQPLADRISFATLYGSLAKGTATAASDIDLLVVADDVRLEDLYSALDAAETKLGRKINPTLYTRLDFLRRRKQGNAFLTRVLEGEHVPLIGNPDVVEASR